MFRRFSLALSAAAVAMVSACDAGKEANPIIPDAPEPVEGLRAATFVADVNLRTGTVAITPPTAGLEFSAIADYFGLEPGSPELSILGGDVVEVLYVPNTVNFAPANAASLRRRVAFAVQIRNKLSGAAMTGPTLLPIPPAGTAAPLVFAFENVTTVTQGGVQGQQGEGNDIIVELPSEGDVLTSDSIWTGPPHNFFNDNACDADGNPDGSNDEDCFLFLEAFDEAGTGSTIQGGAKSDTLRLGYDVELTVNQFRSRIVVAANLLDSTPNVPPTAVITPPSAPCYVGIPLPLSGANSTDVAPGFIAQWQWDFENNGSVDQTGPTTSYTAPSVGPHDIRLTVIDDRGAPDFTVETLSCTIAPANASITKAVQTTGGSPVTQVVEGQTYKYVITVANAGTTTVNDLVVSDALDADINLGSLIISNGGTLAGSTVTWPSTTLAGGSNLVREITFTVNGSTAGGTLDNTANLAASNDTNPADNTFALVTPIVAPPNLLVRWMAAGAPVASVTAGTVVTAQLCTTLNLNSFQADVAYPATVAMTASANLLSSGAGVHPDCAGGADVLDQYVGGAFATPHAFLVYSISADPGAPTRVGIAEFTFNTSAAGNASLSLSGIVSSLFSGATPTFIQDFQTLIIQ